MKKVLFGLLAVTAVAFGANPGDSVPTSSSDAGSVGVPLEVRVTVLPKGPQLVLVDENNVLIKKLSFDHGNMVAGLSSESVIEKEVRLMRADGKAFADNSTDTYKAKFEATDLNGNEIAGNNGTLKLDGHAAASAKSIESKLAFRTGEIAVLPTDTMVMTKVQSIVPALPGDQASGLYVGSGTFKATLTMK